MKVSTRNKEVVQGCAYTFTSKEIARQLGITNHNALSHRKNLITKLGVRNTAGLIRKDLEIGLLSAPSPSNHFVNV